MSIDKFVHELSFYFLFPTSLARHASIRTLLWDCHLSRCMLISGGQELLSVERNLLMSAATDCCKTRIAVS
ncbi:MAG: hypothetical protein ABIJ59_05765 [Pseudomonadota bacterium]